ncbi:hypothetical protein A3A75_01880 [Candidatus Woesebacteria bacterium RIFCSPLOWO2_01_FULL_39_10]|uniref:Nudix hydrolase domain-containing protein n=1 Tax=Candidatus Woesebacteria bacterium RIFCSPLOWO2_01_FULL_39_10 TaxID=1802516 RepID=A0A1F8BC92_9BACT|nr:MAG: hypothetical protein A3A75_01880 [Candidatus Woesebacteria bacterium RIFCSPLOWO2_01_FULL_39_10]
MARRKKGLTEKSAETKLPKKSFTLAIPRPLVSKKEKEEDQDKTSLFVPTEILFTQQADFKPSSFSSDVLVTRNVPEVLKVIFKHGSVSERYGEDGLENDPTRQQIIIYTMITCQKNLLWYQRATSEVKKSTKFIGDARLQGRFTVGFGGHKSYKDIGFSREELIFLRDLLPAIQDEVGTMLGLNHGFFREVEEEIGVPRISVQDLRLLGAFYDKRIEDPLLSVQVGWVHTGIAAVLEVNPEFIDHLTFRSSEIANAWWVPFDKVEKELRTKQGNWLKGKGPKIESWAEIMIKEFWKYYLTSSRV